MDCEKFIVEFIIKRSFNGSITSAFYSSNDVRSYLAVNIGQDIILLQLGPFGETDSRLSCEREEE